MALSPTLKRLKKGVTVKAEKRDLAIEIEMRFSEGYDASAARLDVDATHWQFAPNSGAARSPTHYAFSLLPNGTSFDADEGVPFNPRAVSDTVRVPAYHIKRAGANDAYVTFELQMNKSGFTLTQC